MLEVSLLQLFSFKAKALILFMNVEMVSIVLCKYGTATASCITLVVEGFCDFCVGFCGKVFGLLTLQFNMEIIYLNAGTVFILIHAHIWKIDFGSILKQIKQILLSSLRSKGTNSLCSQLHLCAKRDEMGRIRTSFSVQFKHGLTCTTFSE